MKFWMLITIALLLSACAEHHPSVYGMPLDQWRQLSPDTQQSIITNYQYRKFPRYPKEPSIMISHSTPSAHHTTETSQ